MIKILLICFSLVLIEQVTAQKIQDNQRKLITEDTEQNRTAIGLKTQQVETAAKGTFQVILTDENHQFALNESTLVWIEKSRKENEDQFVVIDENITLFIPSKKTIEKEGFKLLQEVAVQTH